MNDYNQFNYKEYLKSIENKVYKSIYTDSKGHNYYVYSLRHINKTTTKGFSENYMVCISMNHTKLYNPTNINNVVLNLIPLSSLKSGIFTLEDYRLPYLNSVSIQTDDKADYIIDQYDKRPIKNLRLGFKSITDVVNSHINCKYLDLMQNEFTVFKYESYRETYCRDLVNPNLVIFGNIQDIYGGNLSFTKMITNYDMINNKYYYGLYQNQNRLENIHTFDMQDYNQKVIETFGTNNLEWSI